MSFGTYFFPFRVFLFCMDYRIFHKVKKMAILALKIKVYTGIHCQKHSTEITNEVHFLRMCKCPSSELNFQQLKDNTIDMYLALVTRVYFFLESSFGRQSGVRVSQVVVLTNCSGGKGRESDKIPLIILN